MRRLRIPSLLCALLFLAGCSTWQPAPSLSPTPAAEEDTYERFHIDDVGATLLLPKSWAGNYVVETYEGENGFTFAQRDYLAGEWGVREDGTEGPIPDPDGYHIPIASFRYENKSDWSVDPSTFSDTGPAQSLSIWLGEKDGTYYTLWFPTSFSSGDPESTDEKYALYQTMCADIEAYPQNASAYFIFDDEVE